MFLSAHFECVILFTNLFFGTMYYFCTIIGKCSSCWHVYYRFIRLHHCLCMPTNTYLWYVTVAIGKPEQQLRKTSHYRNKQQ